MPLLYRIIFLLTKRRLISKTEYLWPPVRLLYTSCEVFYFRYLGWISQGPSVSQSPILTIQLEIAVVTVGLLVSDANLDSSFCSSDVSVAAHTLRGRRSEKRIRVNLRLQLMCNVSNSLQTVHHLSTKQIVVSVWTLQKCMFVWELSTAESEVILHLLANEPLSTKSHASENVNNWHPRAKHDRVVLSPNRLINVLKIETGAERAHLTTSERADTHPDALKIKPQKSSCRQSMIKTD